MSSETPGVRKPRKTTALSPAPGDAPTPARAPRAKAAKTASGGAAAPSAPAPAATRGRTRRTLAVDDRAQAAPTAAALTQAAADRAGLEALQATILTALDDTKAQDVTLIDLRGRSDIADLMVIASGTSSRQVVSMAENLERRLRAAGMAVLSVEGQRQGDWVLIDAGDAIVHLFRPEVRVFYDLERMWAAPTRPKADGPAPKPRARGRPAADIAGDPDALPKPRRRTKAAAAPAADAANDKQAPAKPRRRTVAAG